LCDSGREQMKSYYLLVAPLFAAANLCAQLSPDLQFSGHTLGETAETFFSTAKMADSKSMTKDYCKSLLDDPKTKEKVEAAKDSMSQQGVFVLNKQDFSLLDVSNCRQVMAALQGENAHVGARLASELGKGTAYFASGKLAAFNLFLDSPYSEAVADMKKRFGVQGQEHAVARSGWPTVKEEMRWEANGVSASVLKNPFSDGVIVFCGVLTAAIRFIPSRHSGLRVAGDFLCPARNTRTGGSANRSHDGSAHPQSSARVSTFGKRESHTRHCSTASRDRYRWTNRRTYADLWSSRTNTSSTGCGETVAIPAVRSFGKARRSCNADQGELQVVTLRNPHRVPLHWRFPVHKQTLLA